MKQVKGKRLKVKNYWLIFLLAFSLSYFLTSANAETTFEPYVGYNIFQKIGPVNNLIDSYTVWPTNTLSYAGQFSEIKSGWDYGGKFGIGISEKLLFIMKGSYTMAATGLRYSDIYKESISEGNLHYQLGFPDNFKIRFLTGQVGLEVVPYNVKRVKIGLSASGGPGICNFSIEGTNIYFDDVYGSSFTSTYNLPYSKTATTYEFALNVEFNPFSLSDKRDFSLSEGAETEPFPIKSTSIEFAIGTKLAKIGSMKSKRNIDTNGDGIYDITKDTTLKDRFITVGNDLNVDLSSIFINLGIKLRW
ncbi:MAG: hypothetical protein WC947_02530 [Elusimicrobiota bacterium]